MPKHSFHIHRDQCHLKWNKKEAPRLTVESGDIVTFDCIDGGNGQITKCSTVDDVTRLNTDLADPVFGPVYVQGASPGDALEVEVLELETADWGWTAILPGFGLLQEDFTEPHLKLWQLPTHKGMNGHATTTGHAATNGHTPGTLAYFNDQIRIPVRPFMGTMGVAPAEDGAFSTIPPLATGGNIDCRHITRGTTLILPVKTPGALFSCGDGHAAQGDGELCGTAIETPVKVTLRLTVRKGQEWIQTPHFHSPPESQKPVLPDRGSYSTIGIDSDMLQATRKAARAMLEYLQVVKGLSKEDAYMLCSVAVDLKMAEVVDMPNFAIVASIPLNIFVDECH